jgi:hypothetical protein
MHLHQVYIIEFNAWLILFLLVIENVVFIIKNITAGP